MKKSFTLHLITVSILILSIIFTSCEQEGRGFALPEGDAEVGKVAFTEFKCNSCHNIGDIEWIGEENGEIQVPLGGKVGRMKTYGELVTSVINPSHKVPRNYREDTTVENGSIMKSYNEVE